MRRRLLVAFALLLACVLPATAMAARTVPRGWAGVVAGTDLTIARPDLVPSEVALMARSGVETLRAAVYWSDLQPTRTGPLHWDRLDTLVAAAARQRIDLLLDPVRAPDWAAANPLTSFPRPQAPGTYAALFTALVKRYGNYGTFWTQRHDLPFRPVHLWQVWNEPDLTFWWTSPWSPTYIATLRAAHNAIKRWDPDATVVLGGLTGRSWDHLAEVYATGNPGLFDVVALHPYTRRVADVARIAELARGIMRRYGDGRKPIWLTEMSWPSSRGHTSRSYTFVVDRAQQAQRAREVLNALARVRRRLLIDRVFWFSWLSRDRSSEEPFDYAGLRTLARGRPRAKPAFFAWRAAALRLEGR